METATSTRAIILKVLKDKLIPIKTCLRKKKCKEIIRTARLVIRSNVTKTRYAISYNRSTKAPEEIWKSLPNTVIKFNDQNFPEYVANGVPEVYDIVTHKLSKILQKQYQIEEIVMGTICWLYYDDNKWMLGTRRTLDTTNILIRSETKSFKKCFMEYLGDRVEIFMNKLNKNYTYGFVLYHIDLHLYNLDKQKCVLKHVSTYDRKGNSIDIEIGLSHPKILISKDLEGSERRTALRDLCISSASSIKSNMNMGFIVRVRKNTFSYDVIVKSPLYNLIEGYTNDLTSVKNVVTNIYFKQKTVQDKFKRIFINLVPNFKEVQNRFSIFSATLLYKMRMNSKEEDSGLLYILSEIRNNNLYAWSLVDMEKSLKKLINSNIDIEYIVKGYL